jgi:hypothetical protein
MTSIGRQALTMLLFGLMAFVGPFVRWMTWPPSAFEQGTSIALSGFISDLVFLLWPTQALAVIEVNTGPVIAAVVAVGANVMLFAVVGVLAGILVNTRLGLPALYLAVGLLLALFALWGAGFSVAYLNVVALAVAVLLYAVPFALTARFAR